MLAPGYLLLIEHSSAWRTAPGEEFDTLLAILDEAAQEWRERNVAFWALLSLPADELAALENQTSADRGNAPEGDSSYTGP